MMDAMEQADFREWTEKQLKKSNDELRIKLVEVTAEIAKLESKWDKVEGSESEDAEQALERLTKKMRKLVSQEGFLQERVTLSPTRQRAGATDECSGEESKGIAQASDSASALQAPVPAPPRATARPARSSVCTVC